MVKEKYEVWLIDLGNHTLIGVEDCIDNAFDYLHKCKATERDLEEGSTKICIKKMSPQGELLREWLGEYIGEGEVGEGDWWNFDNFTLGVFNNE